ncbi:LegC family aminotransferase [Terasakiella sp.]|uniref:LegC family aminotransferase n=1 Tax=Terasakiella sp. TaxID=2034861 RepID=UPI003AA929CC
MSPPLYETIIQAIQKVIGPTEQFTPLHEPHFGGNEWAYVKECIDTGWVSSVGPFVDKFEAELAKVCCVNHAICVVNGTAALHVALLLAGVRSQEEVLIPALTFIATANAVSYLHATPHLIDSSKETLGVDPIKLDEYLDQIAELRADGCYNTQTGKRIAAIVPMHVFGHSVDMVTLNKVMEKWQIPVVEDAAESLGSTLNGKPLGSFGKLAALSFNGNKIMTTGGGGAILTNDPKLGKLAKHLTTTAKVPHPWAFEHDQIAFNYRMPNINAALGYAQLEQLPGFLKKKRALAKAYAEVFEHVDNVNFVREPEKCISNYWLNALLLDETIAEQRDQLLEQTNAQNIMTRPVWNLMNSLPMFKDTPQMDLSVALSLEKRLINIPSSVMLGAAYDT